MKAPTYSLFSDVYCIQVRMEADGTVSEVKVAHTGDPEVIEVYIN